MWKHAAGVLAVIALAGCAGGTETTVEPSSIAPAVVEQEPGPVTVHYKVTAEIDTSFCDDPWADDLSQCGPGGDVPWVDVTESTPAGMSQTEEQAPWTSQDHDFATGESVGISAQAGAGVDTIQCAIYADGVQVATEESSGQYAVVTCAALIP